MNHIHIYHHWLYHLIMNHNYHHSLYIIIQQWIVGNKQFKFVTDVAASSSHLHLLHLPNFILNTLHCHLRYFYFSIFTIASYFIIMHVACEWFLFVWSQELGISAVVVSTYSPSNWSPTLVFKDFACMLT
jgi:hypothetical protein